MNALARVFAFKIIATVTLWCLPLILLPTRLLEAAGLPPQPTYLFVRLLGWAYLALCIGYAFGLHSALHGRRALGPIWVGIVSNGAAAVCLGAYGLSGAFADWGIALQVLAWGSAILAAAITVGLLVFGAWGQGRMKRVARREDQAPDPATG